MGDSAADRYWCYMCSQVVNPVVEAEIKCPFCESGFVEEMSSTRHPNNDGIDLGSQQTISAWAPMLLGLMGGLGLSPSDVQLGAQGQINGSNSEDEDDDLGTVFESLLRRRRRSSASVLRALQNMLPSTASESENHENDRERNSNVVLLDPFNEEALVLQGSFGISQDQNLRNMTERSLGDFLIGPGLDLLLQYLSENDANGCGTPPAQKEAVKAMPTVTVEENMQCSVCLEDFEIGSEAKEMPCKHKFHSGCILPWLELHSSCPICRFQLPSDESEIEVNGTRNSTQ